MSKRDSNVTSDRLAQVIHYDPMSGVFKTLVRRGPLAPGSVIPQDLEIFEVLGACMTLGRIAWILGTGERPKGYVKRKDKHLGFALENLIDLGTQVPKKKSRKVVTQERLRDVLRYCPATGHFSWLQPVSSQAVVGEIAGCIGPDGYCRIRLDGVLYGAHRLAFLYVYGRWPSHLVDHKNGVRSHNWLDNLRDATPSENGQNKRHAIASNRASGLLGVYWSSRIGKCGAKVNHKGRQHHCGFHETPDVAHQAYLKKKRELHEFCTI